MPNAFRRIRYLAVRETMKEHAIEEIRDGYSYIRRSNKIDAREYVDLVYLLAHYRTIIRVLSVALIFIQDGDVRKRRNDLRTSIRNAFYRDERQ